ncbi:hypothetical protein CROQUDRAFT_92926 [Cronartium quercuum f. sp. fusiforme G11]|uniref:Uncharacterized protein n=1 Tax=Cronartium quercuum f. sp. fusiforme G11 TaxID=708437 RepID=A0A9P6NG66_9BASI|nr:hypothetical protein CROQUDRAFT_92926 [Cronartium quercuum f. sp. fusiforme G11]
MHTVGLKHRIKSLRSDVYDPNSFPFSQRFQLKDDREADEEDEDELDCPASIMISNRTRPQLIPTSPSASSSPPLSSESESTASVGMDHDQASLTSSSVLLNSIESLNDLIRFQDPVIQRFQNFHTSSSQVHHARKIIQDFRRQALRKQQPICESSRRNFNLSGTGDWPEMSEQEVGRHQPFDRLIYLLERYTDYCTSIGLPPWPIHHLKVAIWIRGDVVSLKTRVIPLRKSVRCYITSMENVRMKTFEVFHHRCEGDEKMLMSSQVLREILDQLPITRSVANASSYNGGAHADDDSLPGRSDSEMVRLGGYERKLILQTLRAQSGDSLAEAAWEAVREARKRTRTTTGPSGKPKPDPHLHTLQRYQSWANELSIPAWPIEPIRVSIWLRESVLSPGIGEGDQAFKVSLRTVHVYLSRLNFLRRATESLFRERFGNLATGSLYQSQEIINILDSFSSGPQSSARSYQTPSPPSFSTSGRARFHSYRPLTASTNDDQSSIGDGDRGNFNRQSSVLTDHGQNENTHEIINRSPEDTGNRRKRDRMMNSSLSYTDLEPNSSVRDTLDETHPHHQKRAKVDKGCISFILCDPEEEEEDQDEDDDDDDDTGRSIGGEQSYISESFKNLTTVLPLSDPYRSRLNLQRPKWSIPSFSQFVKSISPNVK